ncbi:MAG: sugar ABC transporter ATP-binding protein [Lachnospiraceae bacterium]|nr:sugar ABC transporter ATP-binding protein [Lachnospiraceae bacterium]
MKEKCIYAIDHVSKRFPGVVALDDVSMEVREGEILAVVGENGAGKSTLMNILSGVYEATEGTLAFDGRILQGFNPIMAKELGIAMIHQELSLFNALSVAENIFMGRLPKTKTGMLDKAKLYQDTRLLLQEVGLEKLDPRTLVREINVSQQQQVEIAKALSLEAKLLILDEPTSSLTPREARILLQIMRDLRKKGITMLYISHKLDEILEISDRIAVFRDGKLIRILDTAGTQIEDMITLMVGRKLSGGFVRDRYMEDYEGKKAVLEVEHLQVGNKVKDVSFRLYEGELLGLAGLVGSGRSEVLQALFGADRRDGGTIRIHGREVKMDDTGEAIQNKMALIPEGRKSQSLFLKFTVKENISIVFLKKTLNRLGLNPGGKERQIAREFVSRLNIKTPGIDQKIVNLSGGNQQKAVIARWLVEKPDILFLDEPTQGIDVGAKDEIYGIINDLSKNGTSIIMVSSEMQENLSLCDRVITLYEGRVTGEIRRSELSEERMMAGMSMEKETE